MSIISIVCKCFTATAEYHGLNRSMAMSEGQRKILDIIVAYRRIEHIYDGRFKSALPEEEVRNYLSQLDGLGYIIIGIKVSGADHRMINMTKEGLQVTSNNQRLR